MLPEIVPFVASPFVIPFTLNVAVLLKAPVPNTFTCKPVDCAVLTIVLSAFNEMNVTVTGGGGGARGELRLPPPQEIDGKRIDRMAATTTRRSFIRSDYLEVTLSTLSANRY